MDRFWPLLGHVQDTFLGSFWTLWGHFVGTFPDAFGHLLGTLSTFENFFGGSGAALGSFWGWFLDGFCRYFSDILSNSVLKLVVDGRFRVKEMRPSFLFEPF